MYEPAVWNRSRLSMLNSAGETRGWCAVMRDDRRSKAPWAARDADGTKYGVRAVWKLAQTWQTRPPTAA